MKRREAIQSIALASVGTLFLTSCSDRNVMEFLIDGRLNLDQKHLEYLEKITETFLPVAGVSEKIGNPVNFIMTMVNDMHSPADIERFGLGFEAYKQLMSEGRLKIKSSSADEVIHAVTSALEGDELDPNLEHFIQATKRLTVQNFMTSEHFLVEYRDYKMIPDSYEGCIDV